MKDWKMKYEIYRLTPVEKVNGIWFKRDDKYMPFTDIPLSGGKVRQAISLLGVNQDRIRNECGGNVWTSTNIDSPQGVIVARTASAFGFKPTVLFGGTKMESLMKRPLAQNARACGAEFRLCRAPWESAMNYEVRRLAETEKFFYIKFGINIDADRESILETTAFQVQNLPENLDVLIVPCGSCITFTGILMGLKKWNIAVKRIVGIQISGKNLADYPRTALDFSCPKYDFLVSSDWNYHSKLNVEICRDFVLDPIYEAKAWTYAQTHVPEIAAGKRVCFWCVGNSGMVRKKAYSLQ